MSECFKRLMFCHICARSIRPFQLLSVFITCSISRKAKAFHVAWLPVKLMNPFTTDGGSCSSSNGCIEI